MEEEVLEIVQESAEVATELVDVVAENAPAVVEDVVVNEFASAAIDAEQTIVEQTSSFINWISSFFTWNNLFKVLTALVILLVFYIVYRLLLKGIKKFPGEKMNPHRKMLLSRAAKYLFFVACVMYVCNLIGIKLDAIWGAAGIAGVAIGFAAQTSVSNLISGLFVLTEGTLKVGDVIIVGDITGIVDQISLLSVQVHTYDNQMVRIPNSSIINSNLINNSYHSSRRMTINVSIQYEADMEKALAALQKAPSMCPTVLAEPAPAVWFDGFGDSGINMTVAAWFKPADFLQTKNDLYIAMKKVLDEAGIEIPFNQLDVAIKK